MEAQPFLHWPNSFEVLFCSACRLAVHTSLPSTVPSLIPYHVLVPTYPCDDLRFLQHSWSDTLFIIIIFSFLPDGWEFFRLGWGYSCLHPCKWSPTPRPAKNEWHLCHKVQLMWKSVSCNPCYTCLFWRYRNPVSHIAYLSICPFFPFLFFRIFLSSSVGRLLIIRTVVCAGVLFFS